ncbi:uncharacterized protein LOC127857823 [Dreissena polymorpha]|uniref:uncharacterized protein LOC127857823 n=1 Tax=Dreissena polymorpha TaxID=45954 RepID=UPI0022656AB6|nr:uncharacterized protein LOC127857823 [Dreissena polymorpha]
MDQARAVQRQLSQMTTGKVVVAVNREEERAIKDAFTCVICKGPVSHPIFATCCKSLVGCRTCVDTWYDRPPPASCPKCRSQDGTRHAVTGLNEAVHALRAIVENTN